MNRQDLEDREENILAGFAVIVLARSCAGFQDNMMRNYFPIHPTILLPSSNMSQKIFAVFALLSAAHFANRVIDNGALKSARGFT